MKLPQFRTFLLIALVGAIALPSFGFDLSEIDGDGSPGNAPILLGWPEHAFPLHFLVEPTPTGAAISSGYLFEASQKAFAAWEEASRGAIGLQPLPALQPPETDRVHASLSDGDCVDGASCSRRVAAIFQNWSGTSGAGSTILAITLVKFDPRQRILMDADILVNAQDHQFAPDGSAQTYDLQGILAHEVGHALGVGHPASSDRQDSTMWASSRPGNLELRSLSPDDQNAVLYLYAPRDQPQALPDTNLFGLIERAGATTKRGGCDTGGPGLGGPLLGLFWGLLALSRLGRSRAS